jgi:hypothetical protein
MTGTGSLHVVADGPDRVQTIPTGVQEHGGSNWNKPGDEWGTGIVFSVPGCWEVHLWRDDTSGSASLVIS